MLNAIAAKGRKMVTIIDPHIKRDSGYYIHNKAQAEGDLYVKNNEKREYEGKQKFAAVAAGTMHSIFVFVTFVMFVVALFTPNPFLLPSVLTFFCHSQDTVGPVPVLGLTTAALRHVTGGLRSSAITCTRDLPLRCTFGMT